MTSIKICKISNEDIINQRIYNRNIPSNNLQACISTRAVPTKYVKMPLINHRQESNEQIETVPYYNIKNTFNPGNDKSPYNGLTSQINTGTLKSFFAYKEVIGLYMFLKVIVTYIMKK